MNQENLLVIANGFDKSRRVYMIGCAIPTPDVPLQLLVPTPKPNRTDMLGIACHFQTGVVSAGAPPLHVMVHVLVLSKQCARGIDDYDKLVVHAATNALNLLYLEKHPVIPTEFLSMMCDEAVGSAVHMMREQMQREMMLSQMSQGGAPGLVTPKPGLVIPGQ
jgi:hypothetical protein